MSTSAGNRQRTLVAIDVQHYFRDETSQWSVPRYADIVPVIDTLRKSLPDPAIFTKFVAGPRNTGPEAAIIQPWNQMRLPEDDLGWALTMDTATGDHTFAKGTFSKWGHELADLIPPGAEMVLTGVATDCCILATALGAVDAGRYVTVVTDGCAAVSDEAQDQTLGLLELLSPMCTVVASTELLAGIASTTAVGG